MAGRAQRRKWELNEDAPNEQIVRWRKHADPINQALMQKYSKVWIVK